MADSDAVSVSSLRKVLSKKGLSAAQWMEIGTQLELEYSTLKEIECTYPRSPEKCLLEVLYRWIIKHKRTLEEFKDAIR